MLTEELHYELPVELVAAVPCERRDESRLMVVDRSRRVVEHCVFRDIVGGLRAGDLLVVNDSRVLPAKLTLFRPTGAKITGLFLHEIGAGEWEVLLRTRGKVREGETLRAGAFEFSLTEKLGEGRWRVVISPGKSASAVLAEIGEVPLPPYIEKRRKELGERWDGDRERYQTVYARGVAEGRSVAAPTAGLHFTSELLAALGAKGVQRASVELEVGLGTFLPVETETVEAHPMHTEQYHVSATTRAAIQQVRQQKNRIVSVGTTAVRTLESAAGEILGSATGDLHGETALKIMPGFAFQLTDALITNFHLPRSTLMALVAAFLGDGGVARLKALYAEAIEKRYRFYSYGDAMLIL